MVENVANHSERENGTPQRAVVKCQDRGRGVPPQPMLITMASVGQTFKQVPQSMQ